MSKERLEEIKRQFNINKSKLIRLGRNTHVTDDYEWLIEQTERVQGLEANVYNMDVELEKLYKQNKRYREALEKLVNAPQDMTRGRYADYADRVAREALEESK